MNTKILRILEKNARATVEDIAVVTGLSKQEVRAEISEMESAGVIRGYKAIVDWERVDDSAVTAIIELKVTPQSGMGFEDVAARIAKYPAVESVYLLSGAADLIITVKGKTFREVSDFLARELATLESVNSTATQFVMRRYKELGVELTDEEQDERGNISL